VPTVAAVVAGITRTEPEVSNTTVSAPVSHERLMPAVVRRLDDEGVLVAELTLRGSSLDEVFLSLTGRRPQETSTAEASTEDPEGSVAA
jgi:oleandomycin transport system ATP-binding protein